MERRSQILALLTVLAIAWPTAWSQVTINSIQVEQVSWESDHTGMVPHSEYGHVTVDYITPPELQWFLTWYVNPGTGPVILLKNMPLLGSGIVGSGSFRTTTLVDLGPIGVTRGQSVAGQPFTYGVVFTTDPIDNPPTAPTTLPGVIGATAYRYGGTTTPLDSSNTFLPAADDRPAKPPFGGTDKKWAWRNNLPNQNVGLDQCTPASMTMSAHWLNAEYNGQGINLGPQTWYQTLAKFKADLRTVCPGGTPLVEIVPGKLRFYQRPGKGLTIPGWRVKYQGDRSASGITVFPPSYTEGVLTAHRVGDNPPGTAVKPQFDFVLEELQAGEDVEIHIGWVDENGMRDGGHSLGVRGALRHGNKMYIWTTDDALQENGCTPGSKPSDTVPATRQGLRDAHLSQVLINANGSMHLSGMEPNEVELVTSESPPKPPQPVPATSDWGRVLLLCLVLAAGAAVLAKRRRTVAA